MIFELTFNSHAIHDFDRTELSEIEKISTENNQEIGVTGCLFFHNSEFMGILEGREEVVRELFAKIKKDDRHKIISVLAKGHIAERQFQYWNMIALLQEENEANYRLAVENILALAELSTKRTHGSRLFWNCVRTNLTKPES